MSKLRNVLTLSALAFTTALPVAAQTYGLGRPATEAELTAWSVAVQPNGNGLPEGRGDVLTGEELWVDRCAACHGDFGEGAGAFPVIAGGEGTLTNARPVKTVGSYWPYLSTVWDYVHRSMPFGDAQSLSNDETYAITAYILYSNNLVDDDFELSHENFLEVRLPNEEGFIVDDREAVEFPLFTQEPCMTDCGPARSITRRATDLQSTPEGVVTVFAPGRSEQSGAGGAPAGGMDGGAGEASSSEAPAAEEPATEAAAETAALDPALVAAGEAQWRQCRSCHQVGEGARNGTGPVLNGVVGHVIGSVEGFRYSNVFQEAAAAGRVWTVEELDAFLADPRGAMPGTRMGFRGIRDADDRAAMIAYLQSLSQN